MHKICNRYIYIYTHTQKGIVVLLIKLYIKRSKMKLKRRIFLIKDRAFKTVR